MGEVGGHDEPVAADEGVARGDDAPLAVSSQWYVRLAGVPAVQGPLGLAVADYEDAGRGGHLGGPWLGISLRVGGIASKESVSWVGARSELEGALGVDVAAFHELVV